MPKKKNNHFVSQGIIRFWANQENQVAYWEKKSGGQFEPRNPRSVHSFVYLYARWDALGKRDNRAEDALEAEVDRKAPDQVKKLLKDYPNILPLSAAQRDFWARFVLRTLTRNPVMIYHVLSTWRGTLLRGVFRLKRWLERGQEPDAAYRSRGKRRVLEADIISSLVTKDIDLHVRDFSNKRFAWIVPEDGAPNFVLGSQPYFIKPGPRESDNTSARKNDAFCGVVVHPRIMLALFDDSDEDEIIVVGLEDMQRINGIFCKYSSDIVAVSPKDLDGCWYRPFGHEEGDEVHIFRV